MIQCLVLIYCDIELNSGPNSYKQLYICWETTKTEMCTPDAHSLYILLPQLDHQLLSVYKLHQQEAEAIWLWCSQPDHQPFYFAFDFIFIVQIRRQQISGGLLLGTAHRFRASTKQDGGKRITTLKERNRLALITKELKFRGKNHSCLCYSKSSLTTWQHT